jgi:HK97 family phage portal protein
MNWLRSLLGLVFTGWGGQNFPRGRWSNWGWLNGQLPGSSVDYEVEAGPPWLNGTAAAAFGWLADELPQSRFIVQEHRPDRTLAPVWGHRLETLIARPNPHWTGEQLWQATLIDFLVHGNAYWITTLSRAGDVVELWPIDPERIEPQWPMDGSQWISHYVYQPAGVAYPVPIERVVHFKDRSDPTNPRKGIGRVKAVLREVCTDNEASTYTYTLLKNLGQTGVVISADATGLTDDQADTLVKALQLQTTGDRRFRPIAVTVPVKTGRLGDSPEQMKLDVIPKHIEARICAAIGVSPMVLGLPCAKDFSTYANAEQAAKGSWSRLQAIQRNLAAGVRTQLLPRLDPDPKLTCGWDWSDVPALQTNSKELAIRAALLSKAQILTRKESRELVGYEPMGSPELDDCFITASPPPSNADAPTDPLASPDGGTRSSPPKRRRPSRGLAIDPFWAY